MFRFITNLFTTEETTPSRKFRTTLGMESLEQRETPSSVVPDTSMYTLHSSASDKVIKRTDKKTLWQSKI